MNWSPRSTNAIPPLRPRSSSPSTSFPRNSSISSRSPTCTATWLMPTRRAMSGRTLPLDRGFRPDLGEVDDGGGCGSHVLNARPLADRVVLLAAGEEIRRREALCRQDGAVRSAARDGEARLHAGPTDRLERRVDDARVLLD